MKIATLLPSIPTIVALISVQCTSAFAQPSPKEPLVLLFTVSVARSAEKAFIDTLEKFAVGDDDKGACKKRKDDIKKVERNLPKPANHRGVKLVRFFFRCPTANDATINAFGKASIAAAQIRIPTTRGRPIQPSIRLVVDATYGSGPPGNTHRCTYTTCARDGYADWYSDPRQCTSC